MMPEAVKNLLTTIHRMGNHGPKDLIKKRNSAVHQVARQMERGEVIPLPDIKIATFNIVLLKNSVLTRAVVTRKFQPVTALAAGEFNVGASSRKPTDVTNMAKLGHCFGARASIHHI